MKYDGGRKGTTEEKRDDRGRKGMTEGEKGRQREKGMAQSVVLCSLRGPEIRYVEKQFIGDKVHYMQTLARSPLNG
jgi:hypothetical protein